MAAENSDKNVPIFDGSDYSNWKITILKFLQDKKCKEVVMRAKTDADDEQFDDLDNQASSYIYSAITNKQLEYINDLESAYEIIQKFDEMYLDKSTSLQFDCRHKLENIKLKNYEEVSLYFDDFEGSVNELKRAGAVITEQEKLNYMLKSLPPRYSDIIDVVNALPERERTVDNLKNKIKLKCEEKQNLNTLHSAIDNNATSVNDNKKEVEIKWLLDFRSPVHIINTDEYFETCKILNKYLKVNIGGGKIIEATKVGTIKTFFEVYCEKIHVKICNVLYVKEMKENLLSYPRLSVKSRVVIKGRLAKIYSRGKIIAIAMRDERQALFRMKSFVNVKMLKVNVSKNNMTIKERLHRTLGHINFDYLEVMCKNESLDGLPKEIDPEHLKCATCIENDMHNLPFDNNVRTAEDILQIVHIHLNCPYLMGNHGKKYFLSFIDDYSRLIKVYCIWEWESGNQWERGFK